MTIKSQDWPRCPCVHVTCDISLESSQQGIQLSNLISIGGLHEKLWAPKVIGILIMGIWVLVLWPGTKYIIREGEGGGFPQVRAVISLVNLNLHVVHPSTKSVPSMQ